jgi:hypothetical protein
MMWEFGVNPIRNEEVGVKKVQGGHNSWNSLARVLNLLTNHLSDNDKHIYDVWSRYIKK